MKNRIALVLLVGFISMFGCKKGNNNNETLSNEDLVSQLFNAGMAWHSEQKTVKSTYPINIQVDNNIAGPAGGYIHVLGSVTGSMTINDQTGQITGGSMLLNLTETINDYAFKSNGNTYVMNGAPYVSLTGTFTLLPGGNTFGSASSMQIGGGIHVAGPGLDKTINIQLTIIINTTGTGGTVSGTIDGQSVYFTF